MTLFWDWLRFCPWECRLVTLPNNPGSLKLPAWDSPEGKKLRSRLKVGADEEFARILDPTGDLE